MTPLDQAQMLLRKAARALVARVRSFIEPQIKPATS